MCNNPFHYLLPVDPKDFVGRWQLVKLIASDLTQINGDSYAIIAGRRCGKSSLLNAVAHQLRQLETTDAGDFIVIPISFDFKTLAETIESADAIYARLIKDIYSLVAADAFFRPPDAWPQPVQLTEKQFLDLIKQSALSLSDFQVGITYILDQLDAANQHVRLVLLFDEIDDAIDRPWTQALFSQLRSLIYSSNIKSRVRLIATGSHHLLEQVSNHGSPLWNVLKLNYLEPFNEAGFAELIRRAEDLPKEAADAIWQQSGGHPFLAQYLLHHLWNQGIHQTTKGNVEDMAGKFLAEQANDIKGWARAIGVSGLEAYRILSAMNGWVSGREIILSRNEQSLDIMPGLVALCYHGFVLHDPSWSNYMHSGDLFKEWYKTEGIEFASLLGDQRVVSMQRVSPLHDGSQKNEKITPNYLQSTEIITSSNPHQISSSPMDFKERGKEISDILIDFDPIVPSVETKNAKCVDFLLITALAEERDALLDKLPGHQKLPPSKDDIHTYFQAELPATFPDGKSFSYQVIVMPLLGKGRVQAATSTTEAIKKWHPRYIILIGIAGGMAAQDIKIGDILIADQIVDYELQKLVPEGPQIRWDVHRADPRLLSACDNFISNSWQKLLQNKPPRRRKPKRHIGPIASGDKVVAIGDILKQYRKVWPKLIGIEMEAAGVATAAFQSSGGAGFFMVRCVSDLADEQKGSAKVEKWRSYACDAAAAFAISFLASGPVPFKK